MLGFFAANAVPHKHAHRTANVQNNAAIFFLIILPPVSAQVSCSFIVIKLYHLKNRLSIPETCYSCKFQDVSRRDKQKQPEKAHWPFLAANKKSNSILSGILQFPAAGGCMRRWCGTGPPHRRPGPAGWRSKQENASHPLPLQWVASSVICLSSRTRVDLRPSAGLRGAPPSPAAGPPECPGTPSRTYRGTETPHRRRWS